MTPRWEERPGGLPSGAVETGDGGGHDGHGDQGGGGAPQRLVAGLALVATGLLGVVGGIALDRTALDRRPSFGGSLAAAALPAPSPDEGRRRLGDRMRADLGLTEKAGARDRFDRLGAVPRDRGCALRDGAAYPRHRRGHARSYR